jgi:hypothetical protein
MVTRSGARPALALALSLAAAAAAALPAPLPPQDDVRTCLVCHDDAGLESSAGASVYVDVKSFSASTHGRAGVTCAGCHAALKGVGDFPHASGLEAVNCAGCHAGYAGTSSGSVHGTSSPRLAAAPVLCKDCHGYHSVLTSSDPRSPVHISNRPGTCGRCHPDAGPNYSRGRAHERPSAGGPSPAGVVRALYKVLIGVLAGTFLAYIAADLYRWRREQR